jgi:amino acid adenylation domain-containing protein
VNLDLSDALPFRQADRAAELPLSCLHEMVAEQARLKPDAIALTDGQRQMSYWELEARAEQLAGCLAHLEAGPDRLVGLCAERSIDLVVGILAILKAGAAYLPLDPAAPYDRLAFMLEDAQVSILVTQTALVDRLPSMPAVLLLDGGEESLPSTAPQPAGAGNVAYCIYTSGSTGRPKGVLVSHANAASLLRATEPLFSFGADDVWTLFHSCAFDFSVWELFGCLAYGGRLVIVPLATSRSPETFHELLERERVTVLNMTPSAFRQMAAVAVERPLLRHLRTVIFGGEQLNPTTLGAWTAIYGWERPALINMYGITETTVHVTYRRLRPEDGDFPGRSPIGRPLDHLDIVLMNPERQSVLPGAPGEIYVCGDGVSLGYLNRSELNAERFVSDVRDGKRFYRTGDLGRLTPEGELEYLGRVDQQVKLRGYRVELGEVEAALDGLAPVAEAAAMLAGEGDEARLVAWVTARRGETLDSAELRAKLEQILPSYMVPSQIVAVASLPLNANGKIDQPRLLAMLADARPESKDFRAPSNAAEQALAAIWERVLEIRPIGSTDNFFAMGGDSIRALQVIRAAREEGLGVTLADLARTADLAELAASAVSEGDGQEPGSADLAEDLAAIWKEVTSAEDVGAGDNFFAIGGDSMRALQAIELAKSRGIAITLRDLLGTETLTDLAARARRDGSTPPFGNGTPTAAADDAAMQYPLSAMQRLMVAAYAGNADRPIGLYHAQQALRFRNPGASGAHLAEALRRVTEAHPMLRTGFLPDGRGGAEQVVRPTAEIDFREADVSSLSPQAQEDALIRAMVDDRRDPFRQTDPDAILLRLRMLRRSDDEFDLLVASHHGVEDGWGSQLFLADLLGVYAALQAGRAPTLEARGNVFREFVDIEAREARAAETAELWRSCRARAAGGPAPFTSRAAAVLPPDFEPTLTLPKEAARRVRETALRHRVSIKAVLLTAYQAALAELLDWAEPAIGVVTSGRGPGLSDPLGALGMFWSFVPFATPALPLDESGFRRTMTHLAALEERATGLCALNQAAIAAGELFTVTFNFTELHNSPLRSRTRQLTGEFLNGFDKFHYPLNALFSIHPMDRTLSLHFEYDHRLVDPAIVRMLEARIERLLLKL